jgi:hypothetical protein
MKFLEHQKQRSFQLGLIWYMTNTFPKTIHRIENYTHNQLFRILKVPNLPHAS